MTDNDFDDPDDDGLQDATTEDPPAAERPWLKPLVLFAIALACGLVASLLWMRLHPRPATTPLASDAAVALDPAHRTLPAPMAGGNTNLPVQTAPAPDAPHIVSPEPDTAAPSDSTDVDAATAGAETTQAQASADSDGARSDEAASDNDVGPQVGERTPPQYPPDALRSRTEGTVHLTVSIDAQGNVADVRVARSSGSNELDRAAIDTVRGWRYKPATRDGQPVPSTTEVPIDFKLDGQP